MQLKYYTRCFAILLLIFAINGFAFGQTTTWTGTTNTDWTLASNWSNGVPTNTFDIVIPNVANDPILLTNVTVNSLTINAGGNLTINAGGVLNVNTNATNAGTLNLNAGDAAITGNLNSTGVLTIGNGRNLGLNGNFTVDGTFTATNPSTFTLNGTTTQTISGTATTNFITFTLNKTGGNVILDKNALITNDLTVPVGVTFTLSTNRTLTVNNNIFNNGTFNNTNVGSIISFGGTSNITISTLPNTNITNYRNITIAKTGGGTVTLAQNVTVTDDILINSGTLTLNTGINLSFDDDFTNNGTFTANATSIVTCGGTGTSTIDGTTSPTTFQTFNITKTAGTVSIDEDLTIVNNFTVPNTILLRIEAGIALRLQANLITNSSLDNTQTGSIVIFTGTSAATVTGTADPNFRNLQISKTGGGSLSINRNSSVLYDIDIDPGAILTLNANLSITDDGLFSNDGTFNANSHTLSLAGDFDNDATFNAGTGTVVFGETNDTELRGAVTTTFYNFTINKTGGAELDLDRQANVSNILTLTSGIIVADDTDILQLNAGSSYTGGSNTSHIEGPMRKVGNTSFAFPVGNGGFWARIEVVVETAGAATDVFLAEYFRASFMNSTCQTPITDVSDKETWRLERTGTTQARVKLYWEDAFASGLNSSTPANLRVAQWNLAGTTWQDRGVTTLTGSTLNNNTGTIESGTGAAFVFSTNERWTIAHTTNNTDWYAITWTGNIDTRWELGGNWSPTTVPTATEDVIIPDDRPNYPIISTTTGNVTVNSLSLPLNIFPNTPTPPVISSLTVDAGLVLTIGSGSQNGTVIISGTLNNSGTITCSNLFYLENDGILNNNAGGNLTVTQNTGTFINGDDGTINNSGTITVTGNRRFDNQEQATLNNLATGIIVSNGEFRNRNTGSGTASINNAGVIRLHRNFTNDRPLNGAGTLSFQGNNSQTVSGSNSISHNMNFDAAPTAKAGGTVTFNTTPADITCTSSLTIPTGVTLQVNANKNFIIHGNLTQNGSITTQNPSTFTFGGATNTFYSGTGAAATLNIVINNKTGGANTQINKSVTFGGNFTNTIGTFQINNGFTLTMSNGDFTNNATFTAQTGSIITFIGSTRSSIIAGTNPITFDICSVGKTGGRTLTLNRQVNIAASLTFTNGIVNTSTANLLVIQDGATASGGNASSYVNGPLRKIGDEPFIFAVGKGTKWARIEIKDFNLGTTSPNDYFTAQYFDTRFTGYGYRENTQMLAPLEDTSEKEYWALNRGNTLGGGGTTEAKVVLYWEDGAFSGINNTAVADLVVAHGNGSAWESKGGTVTGSTTAGSVESTGTLTTFSPFTFGSLSSSFNPLPVTLLSFEAKVIDNQEVNLKWATATEQDVSHFEVERSIDAASFEVVREVGAAGNSNRILNYETTDKDPYAGISYYRLKTIDTDNSFKYSNIISVEVNPENRVAIENIYPNPFVTEFTIRFLVPPNSPYQVQLIDLQGRIIFSKEAKSGNSSQTELKIQAENLPKATYILKLYSTGKQLTKQVIKIN